MACRKSVIRSPASRCRASVRERMTYTGYLRRTAGELQLTPEIDGIIDSEFLLVTPGGGGDGEALIDLVLSAYEHDRTIPYPALLVFGPFMLPEQRAAFAARAARLDNVRTITFNARLESLMARAAGVVAMGGYNTFCEILSFDKRALIVPRTAPRLEQFIRTKRAAELGLLTMLSEQDGRDPQVMADGAPPPRAAAAPFRRAHSRPPRRHARGQPPGAELARPGAAPVASRPGRASEPERGARSSRAGGPRRLCPEGLSAPLRNLHRAGDPRAGAARARNPDRLACGIRPTARRIRSTDLIRAALLYLPEYLYQEPRRVWRGWRALAPAARIPPGSSRLARRPAPRSDPEPRPPLWPGAGAGGRTAGRYRPAACAFSAHAGLGRPLCRDDRRPRLVGFGARQGHLDPAGMGEAHESSPRQAGS